MTIPSDDPVRSVPAPPGPPDREVTAPADGATAAAFRHRASMRHRWRRWRRTRPFWGAVFVIVGATEILLSVSMPLPVILHIGLQGLAGYIVPFVLLLSGIFLLVQPQHRTFYSIIALVLALATWLTSNLGGFIVGMLFGIIGGSLAFAWAPRRPTTPPVATETPQETSETFAGTYPTVPIPRGHDTEAYPGPRPG